jgi:hypothetical protein
MRLLNVGIKLFDVFQQGRRTYFLRYRVGKRAYDKHFTLAECPTRVQQQQQTYADLHFIAKLKKQEI